MPNKKCLYLFVTAFVLCFTRPVCAQDTDFDKNPWAKYSVEIGGLVSAIDTSLNLAPKGFGVIVDVEDFFGMDNSDSVFILNSSWRFTKNNLHRLNFQYSSFHRNGFREILDDITFEDRDGNEVTIPAGSQVSSKFYIDRFKVNYSYSFFQDDRMDLAAGAGLYWMPIDIGLNSTGLINVNERETFNAPLPTAGLRADFAITPKWFLRTNLELFYLEIDKFKGSIYESNAAIEYLPWKNIGFGFAFNTFNLHIESDGEDYPEIDFNGTLNFNITGLSLYMKMFF